jgi:hypothetical protein
VNRPVKEQETRSLSDLHLVVRDALSHALGGEVSGPLLRIHLKDKQGRNWDVSGPTPPQHREMIDGLRDRYSAS